MSRNRKAEKREYTIHLNHPVRGADEVGIVCRSVAAVHRKVRAILTDPESIGYSEWINEASVRVYDSRGNIVYA